MNRVFGSFRDTSGHVIIEGDRIIRVIFEEYAAHFEKFVASGLRDELISSGDLIPFYEISSVSAPGAWKALATETVPFFSYPYEWSFSQLRDAALLTLRIQIACLKKGLILKDASAYNVTIHKGRAVFIDLLSFEAWTEGKPWQAYRQFCSHFLAPLLLMSKVDNRMIHLLRTHIDGIPLDLASRLLPLRTRLNLPILLHVHIHAWAQKKYNDNNISAGEARKVKISLNQLIGIAEQLYSMIERLPAPGNRTTWENYYSECTYSDEATAEKLRLVRDMVAEAAPLKVIDLGANDGYYSRAISNNVNQVVSTDFDSRAVDINYLKNRAQGVVNVLPLLLDLANPTAGVGFANRERFSFKERTSFDLALALAVIHHLAITAAIPLPMIAAEFSTLARDLLVEWVPPEDNQVLRISAMNPKNLQTYSYQNFISAFGKYFYLVRSETLPNSGRSLHLFRRKV